LFTGLVADLGTVAEVHSTNDGVRLAIESELARELSEGDSVSVNGVCLTAVGLCGDRFGADVMNETLRRSSLAEVQPGSRVNLELPLTPTARLGGHFVQGHVDGVGAIAAVREDGFARIVTIEADPGLLRYVVEKGSITVDGVSLTVARIDDHSFDVSLIPETLERTNLGAAAPGAPVNLEVDILAKYVEKLSRGVMPNSPITTRGRTPRGGDSE
jgi:riboflavin synthase